jgi:hypothetical protein
MTKKHFVALADAIREFNRLTRDGSETANHFDTQQIGVLADFCQEQNGHFNRRLWLDYIAGTCGPNGGRK